MKTTQNRYTVYKHTTPSGKVYIGLTGLPVEKRWLNGRGYRRNQHFWNAIQKYGWSNIKHEVVAQGLTRDEAGRLEKQLIRKIQSYKPSKGYNGTMGGEKGVIFTPESRAKLSRSKKGKRYNVGVPFTEERKRHLRENHADVMGEKNPNYGKKWSKEQLAIRQAHRTYKRGGENPMARPILQLDMNGNLVKRWGSIAEAAKEYCRTSIKDCLRGKYKQYRGYMWRYENERNS